MQERAGAADAHLLRAERPRVVGIVNITEDSFSDGGRYLAPAEAVSHARRLHADGADISELGAAASNPDSKPVTPAEEQRRLAPVLDRLLAEGMTLSVETFQPATQLFALSRGAMYLNDIQGFPDPALTAEDPPGAGLVLSASRSRIVGRRGFGTEPITSSVLAERTMMRSAVRRTAHRPLYSLLRSAAVRLFAPLAQAGDGSCGIVIPAAAVRTTPRAGHRGAGRTRADAGWTAACPGRPA